MMGVLGPIFGSGIKRLSVQDLERLTEEALANPNWSATGRPDWLRENRGSIAGAWIVPFDMEGAGAIRCTVYVELKDKTKCNFTLDIARSEWRHLQRASQTEVFTLARRFLNTFPFRPLDPAQEARWAEHRAELRSNRRKPSGEQDGDT
jgi:hypothetical protein